MNIPKTRIARTTQPYLFQNAFVLTDLPAGDLQEIKKSAKLVNGKRGEVLFKQGAFPKTVIWIISGKAKIFQQTTGGQRQTLYIYSNGDLMGYRQLIANVPHPVSAGLLEDSTYMIVPAEVFLRLINSSPFFAKNVLSALAQEFTVWMNRMTVFTKFQVRRRLILALLILHEQYHASGSPNGTITITRTELAEYVGASLETVVRALNGLKRNHLVTIQGRSILLNDIKGLMDSLEQEKK